MKLVYMCRTGFKNWGEGCLGSGPSLKMGGFQSGHSREKQGILELKITKKRILFLNEGLFDLPRSEKRNKELYTFEKGVFWSGPCRKSRVFRSGQGRNMGGFRGSTPPPPGTYLPT